MIQWSPLTEAWVAQIAVDDGNDPTAAVIADTTWITRAEAAGFLERRLPEHADSIPDSFPRGSRVHGALFPAKLRSRLVGGRVTQRREPDYNQIKRLYLNGHGAVVR